MANLQRMIVANLDEEHHQDYRRMCTIVKSRTHVTARPDVDLEVITTRVVVPIIRNRVNFYKPYAHTNWALLRKQYNEKFLKEQSIGDFLQTIKTDRDWEWLFGLPKDSLIAQQYRNLVLKHKQRQRLFDRRAGLCRYAKKYTMCGNPFELLNMAQNENGWMDETDCFDMIYQSELVVEDTTNCVDLCLHHDVVPSITYCNYCHSIYGEYCSCETSLYERLDPFMIAAYQKSCGVKEDVPLLPKRDPELYKKLQFSILLKSILRYKFSRLTFLRVLNNRTQRFRNMTYFSSKIIVPIRFYLNRFLNLSNREKAEEIAMELFPIEHLGRSIGNYDEIGREYIQAEMENSEVLDQTKTVILDSTVDVSEGDTIHVPGSEDWVNMSTTYPSVSFNELTDRWSKWDTFTWSVSDQQNKVLVDQSLPYNFVKSNLDSQICTLFKNYTYWQGDIEVKVQVNANPFQIGCLQQSFYYGYSSDKYAVDRKNVWSQSMCLHSDIMASESVDCILRIPYRYFKTLLSIKSADGDITNLDMGRYFIIVKSPLRVTSKGYQQCDVSMFVRFPRSEFVGMIDRTLGKIEGEMMPVAKMAQGILNTILPDKQRDNPPNVLQPKPLVPWSAHSWCAGDLVDEPINPLRLQQIGQTPHPSGTLPLEDEMSIDYVKQQYGLVKTIHWSASDVKGKILAILPASPIWDEIEYPYVSISNKEARNCFIYPPCAILAELFHQWRGSIDLKFQAIASQFHTGRLMIAYIPRVPLNKDLKLDQARNCIMTTVNIRDQKEWVFEVPYISDLAWWQKASARQSASSNYLYPGYVYVMVLHQLALMDTVAKDLDILVYKRGSKNLEYAIPVSPYIGLSFNTDITMLEPGYVKCLDGYGPPENTIGCGGWHNISGGNRYVVRYGDGSDHITQFKLSNFQKGRIYKIVEDTLGPRVLIKETSKYLVFPYLVRIYIKSLGDYIYGACFTTFENAAKCANNPTVTGETDVTKMEVYAPAQVEVTYDSHTRPPIWQEVASYEWVEAQVDERERSAENVISFGQSLYSTNSGLNFFGEKFYDLRQLCRRYQPYAMFLGKSGTTATFLVADYGFPLMPQGLDLVLENPLDKDEHLYYGNIVRDGVIPIIASGYRFYRGGLRFRLIILSPLDCCVWVQHKPDIMYETGRVPKVYNNKIPDINSTFSTGYATLFQGTAVNQIVEFEVPYYLPTQLGLLQVPDGKSGDAQHFCLGYLNIALWAMKSIDDGKVYKIPCVLSYSIADDMSFTVFQGFPPVFSVKPAIQGEMMGWLNRCKQSVARSIVSEVRTEVAKQASESLQQTVLDGIDSKRKDVRELQLLSRQMQQGELTLFDYLTMVCADLPEQRKSVVVNCLLQLLHTWINPSLKTICLAIASCLVNMGLMALSFLENFGLRLYNVVKNFFYRPVLNTSQFGEVIQAEAEADDIAARSALMSTCVAGVLALGGRKEKITNIPDFCNMLYSGCSKFTLTANNLCIFFKNNITMFDKMYNWLMGKLFPSANFVLKMVQGNDVLEKWTQEVIWCINPLNLEEVRSNPADTLKVYHAASFGNYLRCQLALMSSKHNSPELGKLINDINKLRDMLTKEKLSPPVRFEPYVICLSGPPNCGKSHLGQEIANELLKSINYTSFEEVVYTRTPGNPYWQMLRNQPVCLYDDFLAIGEPTIALGQIAELFCLKSKAVFNPPQAEIENKNIRYNPYIVILCTNYPFPEISGISKSEPWMRRRDILIDMTNNNKFKGHIRDMPEDVKQNYMHIDFKKYKSSITEVAGLESYKDYSDMLNDLKIKFKNFYIEESKQYEKRLRDQSRFYPNYNITDDSFLDVMTKITKLDKSKLVCSTDDSVVRYMNQVLIDHAGKPDDVFSRMYSYFKNNTLSYDRIKKYICDKTGVIVQTDEIVEPLVQEIQAEAPEVGVSFNCPHQDMLDLSSWVQIDFVGDNASYDAEKYKHIVRGNGVFKYEDEDGDSVYVSDIPCKEMDVCRWGNSQYYASDMRDWEGIRFNRELVSGCVKDGRLEHIPKYFDMMYTATLTRISRVEEEISPSRWTYFIQDVLPKVYGMLLSVIWGAAWLALALTCLVGFGKLLKNTVMGDAGRSTPRDIVDSVDETLGRNSSDLIKPKILIEEQTQSENLGTYSPGKTVGVSKYGKTAVAHALKEAQASGEQTDVMIQLIKRNTFWILAEYIVGDEVKYLKGRCIGLIDRNFLFIDHYLINFEMAPADSKFFYLTSSSKIPINFSDISFCRFTNSALFVGMMPKVIPCFKNLIKFIQPQSSTRYLPRKVKFLDFNVKDGEVILIAENLDVEIRENIQIDNGNGSETQVEKLLSYNKSGKGLCGAIIIADHNTPTPILAVHVAGVVGGSRGFAELLIRESFDSLEKRCFVKDLVEPEMLPITQAKIPLSSVAVDSLGCVDKKLTHNEAGKSKNVLTECAGEITELTYDQPVLSPRDIRIEDDSFSPMYEGCAFHGQPPIPFPDEILCIAVRDYKNVILSGCKPVRSGVGVLSVEDAVCGFPGLDSYESINLHTSEGFPFVSSRPKGENNKSWLFKFTDDTHTKLNGLHPMLEKVMLEKMELRKQGIVPFTVFTDCLKDIKLPKEKCLQRGKTRIFSISPVDFTIQLRQYFLDFVAAFQVNRMKLEHSIGINVNSVEWTDLRMKLETNSSHVICGDYSKFGPRLNSQCVAAVFDIIIEWYQVYGCSTVLEDSIRRIMGEETIFSLHQILNLIYRVYCGAPSGNPITVIINSMVNSLYVRMAWIGIMRQRAPEYASLVDFHKNIVLSSLGDDLIMSVKSEVVQHFNSITLSDFFQKFDIKYTDALKSGVMQPYTSFDDETCTFLKCRWKKHPYRSRLYLAELEKRCVYEICNWMWDHWDKEEGSFQACLSMMEQAYGLGHLEYDDLKARVLLYWQEKGRVIHIPEWLEIDNRCFGESPPVMQSITNRISLLSLVYDV